MFRKDEVSSGAGDGDVCRARWRRLCCKVGGVSDKGPTRLASLHDSKRVMSECRLDMIWYTSVTIKTLLTWNSGVDMPSNRPTHAEQSGSKESLTLADAPYQLRQC